MVSYNPIFSYGMVENLLMCRVKIETKSPENIQQVIQTQDF